MTRRTGTPLVDALVREADETGAWGELAERLRPYLAADLEQLLDARDAARRMRVHPETLVRWAREGRVKALKVGREWRFYPDELTVASPRPSRALSPSPPPRRREPIRERGSFEAIRGRA